LAKDYDKTLTRLIGILSKLSNDERYNTKEFAQEYNVGVRTIQKDINERLVSFPITKDNNGKFIFIKGFTLNKSLLNNDEMMLVSLALTQFQEVSDFDKLTNSTMKKLLKPQTFNPYYIKQDNLEDININSLYINKIEKAIQYSQIINIDDKEVEAYKIVAFAGIWYLFAKDLSDNKIKTFMLNKIKNIKSVNRYYKTSKEQIDLILYKTHSAWFEDGQSFKVTVKIDKQIAVYFKQKQFLQSQNIEEELENGDLIISFEVSHDEDVDNIIKSWIPHIIILKPIRFRNKLTKELKDYIKRLGI